MRKLKNNILYSVGTHFAWKINHDYYNDIHYCWCSTKFHDMKQPPTSDPQTIIQRYIQQIHTGDVHAKEIEANIAGILRGAKLKLDDGIIDNDAYTKIGELCANPTFEAFFPVIYIIDVKKVGFARCKEVSIRQKASKHSIEYIIEDLKPGEYEMIDCINMFGEYVVTTDSRQGVSDNA